MKGNRKLHISLILSLIFCLCLAACGTVQTETADQSTKTQTEAAADSDANDPNSVAYKNKKKVEEASKAAEKARAEAAAENSGETVTGSSIGVSSGTAVADLKTDSERASDSLTTQYGTESASQGENGQGDAGAETSSDDSGAQSPSTARQAGQTASNGDFDPATVPAYSGSPVFVVNNNTPYFSDSDLTTTAFETYSPLDSLGRCGVAYANICKEIMPTEPRGTIGSVKPSGWHTVKYNGVVDGNYLYNRCHLIAYELAGENANTKNLITGTRYMNVQGMLPYENDTAAYVERTGHHVLYRVTPIFDGSNLVASGVLMEARSVEDNNIYFCVYAYNVQPGIWIDYATGDSSLAKVADGQSDTAGNTADGNQAAGGQNGSGDNARPAESTVPAPTATQTPAATQDVTGTYVLNTNTKKFHLPTCSSVDTIKAKNRSDYTGSRQALIDQGYQPCKRCNP